MDLKEFYLQNVKESEYHYRFRESVLNVNKRYNVFCGYEDVEDYEFQIFDTEEAITKFKELCQPEVSFSDNEKKCWFYLVSYYLFKMGYEIKEFPRILARPPIEPSDFAYGDIRNKIIARQKKSPSHIVETGIFKFYKKHCVQMFLSGNYKLR